MKIGLWLLTVLVAVAARAEQAATPLRLALDLTDGSHVIGVPALKALPLETPYAKMNIELEKIRSLKLESDHKAVALELNNGDRLAATLTMPPLELTTAFGKVAIALEHIRKISVLPGGATSGQLPPELLEKLVLHYRFDRLENDGQSVRDLSDGGHNGALHGAAAVQDARFGRVLQFDGAKDYVDVDAEGAIGKQLGQGDFTVVVWIKTQPQANATGYIVEQHVAGSPWTGLYLSLEGGKCRFRTEDSRSSGSHVVFDSQPLLDERWHCVVALRKNSVLQIFLDGEKKAEQEVPLADFNTKYAGPLRLGAHCENGAAANYKGQLAGLLLFARALSDAEIAKLSAQ